MKVSELGARRPVRGNTHRKHKLKFNYTWVKAKLGILWKGGGRGNTKEIVKNVGLSPPRGKTEFAQNFTLWVGTVLKFECDRKETPTLGWIERKRIRGKRKMRFFTKLAKVFGKQNVLYDITVTEQGNHTDN